MNLLASLLTGRVPISIQSAYPRASDGAWPTTLEVDHDGYPDDWQVEQISMVALDRAIEWLLTMFADVWSELDRYGSVEVGEVLDILDRPAQRIRVATGGWSGCEHVISAVLGHPLMAGYCEHRGAGGVFVFVVPLGLPR